LLSVTNLQSIDFRAEERPSDSPFIERVWHSRSDEYSGTPFTSMAETHWSMVVSKIRGRTTITVRGPEIRATPAYSPPEAEFFGIMFKPGTLMPLFPARMVMDRQDINLPGAASQSFWLNGAAWQYPDFENAETFVNRLARDGLLIHDPIVSAVLQGQPVGASLRTVQRRFLQATGLTYNTISQIKRARYATMLLKQGIPILDVVYEASYADQPHLTRSLKQYTGQTPAQITAESQRGPLSFLFKTFPY
jgi:AraC-like DNA-binding protein